MPLTFDLLALIENLQELHDMLIDYKAPKVAHPTIESLQPVKMSFLSSLFQRESTNKETQEISEELPKGIYMYGDVGSGKTMMMDLFYDTLPPNITHKTRIHFHNFMQEVHRELHKNKMRHGNDFDAVPFVAADIAERSTVLCFDEFQCTDVADAMILRRYDTLLPFCPFALLPFCPFIYSRRRSIHPS
jgi:predicted ATPase